MEKCKRKTLTILGTRVHTYIHRILYFFDVDEMIGKGSHSSKIRYFPKLWYTVIEISKNKYMVFNKRNAIRSEFLKEVTTKFDVGWNVVSFQAKYINLTKYFVSRATKKVAEGTIAEVMLVFDGNRSIHILFGR